MEVHAFLKGISLKVNVISQQEFKLSSYDVTVQNINNHVTQTPPKVCLDNAWKKNYTINLDNT